MNFISKLINVTIFGFISILPTTIWLTRNYILSSTLTGGRPSPYIYRKNIDITVNAVSSWFLPSKIPFSLKVIFLLLLLTIIIITLTIITRNNRGSRLRTGLLQVSIAASFSCVYIVSLIITAEIILIPLCFRLLVPIYVPLMILIFFTISNIPQLVNQHFFKKASNLFLIFIVTLWLVFSFLRVVKHTRYYLQNGAGGYSTVGWRNSELIRYLGEHPLNGYVFSNYSQGIYLLTGMYTRLSRPKYIYYFTKRAKVELLRYRSSKTRDRNTYLVWFENKPGEDAYSPRKPHYVVGMKIVTKKSDGAIYLVK